jgi:hypothetical protein
MSAFGCITVQQINKVIYLSRSSCHNSFLLLDVEKSFEVVVETFMERGNATGQRGSGTVRAAHGRNLLRLLIVGGIYIEMPQAPFHSTVEHCYQIINHLFFVHSLVLQIRWEMPEGKSV